MRYEVVRALGAGKVAALYEVRDPGTGISMLLQDFVLKPAAEGPTERVPEIAWDALEGANRIDPAGAMDDAPKGKCQEWFGRELRRVAGWTADMLPRIVAAGATEERAVLILETGGESLMARVEREGPMDEAAALKTLEPVLDFLATMHGKKPQVVVSDVRPSNLRVDASGRVGFLTYGDTRFIEPPRRGLVLRSGPVFTSPERRRNAAESPASDIWCAAALLWFLLTGKPPGEGTPQAGEITRRVLDRALNESADKRYKSIAELRRALQGHEPEEEDKRPPVLVVDRDEILEGPVEPGAIVEGVFRVTNQGGGTMKVHVEPSADWMTVNPADFESNDEEVRWWANTEKLMPENPHSTIVKVSVGKQVKPIRFTIRLGAKPRMTTGDRSGWLLRLLLPVGTLVAGLIIYGTTYGWGPILKFLRLN